MRVDILTIFPEFFRGPLDYGIVLNGERTLHTDDGVRDLKPGAIVVQIGSWHAWSNPHEDSQMAFMMMGAKFDE